MPFGGGGFECPANSFAPKMIGILVSSLAVGFQGWRVVEDYELVVKKGSLEAERAAYGGLRLARV